MLAPVASTRVALMIENYRSGLRWRLLRMLGTFALVAIGPSAAMVAASTHTFGQTGIALAFGLVVTLVVASTGHLG